MCANAGPWREQLLSAAAQASRLLLESSDVMERMPDVLRLIGEAAEVDRTTLALVDECEDERWLEIKSQWTAPAFAQADGTEVVPQPRRLDCYCTELKAGRSVYLCGDDWRADSSIASPEARSSIIVPFLVEGRYAGAVGLDTLQAERRFDTAVVSALEIAASVIGAALQRDRLLDTMRRERELAAEQRVSELARANAALRANLARLANQPAEFFSHLLLEIVRLTEAHTATAITVSGDSEHWRVVCHCLEGRVADAPFADSVPQPGSPFIAQMSALREPLHVDLGHHDEAHQPAWPEMMQFHLDAGVRSVFLLPLVFGEGSIGLVGLGFREHRRLPLELTELMVAFAQQVTLALAMKRMMYTVNQAAMLAERNRIGREIHDGLAQAFTGILMQLGAAEEQAEGTPLASVFTKVRDIAREGLTEARRSVLALRPDEQPRQGGLELALRQLAERSTAPGGITSSFHGGGATGLPPEHEHALLRIAQEAVMNAVRHAEPSRIEIHLDCGGEEVLLQVRDDGKGMQRMPGLYARQGFGLANMRDRAESLGGHWQLESEPQAGTRIMVRMPRAVKA